MSRTDGTHLGRERAVRRRRQQLAGLVAATVISVGLGATLSACSSSAKDKPDHPPSTTAPTVTTTTTTTTGGASGVSY